MSKCGWYRLATIFVALSGSMMLPAQAKQPASSATGDAAYLEEAFSHDLCTRNDRDLRKLNKALSKRTTTGSH